MIWSYWLHEAALVLELTDEQAGILLSLLISVLLALTFTVATKGKRAAEVMMGSLLVSVIIFTFMGWFPLWTGSVIGLILALLLARTVSGGF